MRIMKEEQNTEINISITETDHAVNLSNQSLPGRSDHVIPPTISITLDVLGYDDNIK